MALSGDADDVAWLQSWYSSRCDGEWEHHHGLQLQTLDNPGWWLRIDLAGTGLEGCPFPEVREGEPSEDLAAWQKRGSWWTVSVKDCKFDAACGPLDLISVIRIFRGWVEQATSQPEIRLDCDPLGAEHSEVVRGWGVVRKEPPWHLVGIFQTRAEAEAKLGRLSEDYTVRFGEGREALNEFVWSTTGTFGSPPEEAR